MNTTKNKTTQSKICDEGKNIGCNGCQWLINYKCTNKNFQSNKKQLIDSKISFLSDLYDYLYKRADELIKYYQPCHIHQENNGNQCINGRLKLCCVGCKHFSKNNYCKVEALECKLWLCTRAQDTNPILANNLIELKAIAYKFNLYGFRMSKKEIFKKQFGVNI